MILHVVGLPHTELTHEYATCAYTQKIVKFVRMMTDAGYEVVTYAGPRNETPSARHHVVVTEKERLKWFGPWQPQRLPDVSWVSGDQHWTTMNRRVVKLLKKNAGERDIVCLVGGVAQQPIAEAVPQLSVEWGVGSDGIFSPFCCFESRAWMHYVYGMKGIVDGRWFDTVVPNFFDPADFTIVPKRGYLLYLGRVVIRKGVHVAAQIAERLGQPLVVAGPGVLNVGDDAESVLVYEDEQGNSTHGLRTRTLHCTEMTLEGCDFIYTGPVGIESRARLLGAAGVLLAPTQYIEPFGGVAVEAMMAGTPAVTTDWGAFPETVREHVSGFRFRTLAGGVDAVEQALDLHPKEIRQYAHRHFSLEAVAPRYDRWFQQLQTLWGKGWDA